MLISGIATSRALVAAVPLQEVTWISLKRPPAKDFRFSMVVAPVSTRNRSSLVPTVTLTTGNRSQRSRGISSASGALCARRPAEDQNKRDASRAVFITYIVAPKILAPNGARRSQIRNAASYHRARLKLCAESHSIRPPGNGRLGSRPAVQRHPLRPCIQRWLAVDLARQ